MDTIAKKNNIGRLVNIAHELMLDYPVRIYMKEEKLVVTASWTRDLEIIGRNHKLLLIEVFNNQFTRIGVFKHKE